MGSPSVPYYTQRSQTTRYLFVGGFHHSGTSLVHTVLASQFGVASLLGSNPKQQDEGFYLQNVYSPPSERTEGTCSPYPLTLCLTTIDALVDTEAKRSLARTRLLEAWRPFWQRTNASALLRVEKDPDLGTLFLKHALFAPSTLIAVMRHPLYSHATFYNLCSSVFDCVRLWTITWAHTLQRMRSVSTFAIVRYEDFVCGDTACWAEFMIHLLPASMGPAVSDGSEGPVGRRSLMNSFGLRHSNGSSEELVQPRYVWAWAARPNRQALLRDQLASELEAPMRALSGYSLVTPEASNVSCACGVAICSSDACPFDARMRGEGRAILQRLQQIARWWHWDQLEPMKVAVQSTLLASPRQPPTRPPSSPPPTSVPLTILARPIVASTKSNSLSLDQSERVDAHGRFWWGWVVVQLTLVAFAALLMRAYFIAAPTYETPFHLLSARSATHPTVHVVRCTADYSSEDARTSHDT